MSDLFIKTAILATLWSFTIAVVVVIVAIMPSATTVASMIVFYSSAIIFIGSMFSIMPLISTMRSPAIIFFVVGV